MATTKVLIKNTVVFTFLLIGLTMYNKVNSQIKIGIFADCQYCDCETQGNRHYKNSLKKLSDCIQTFNSDNLEFVVGLGDLIDRDFASFEQANSVLEESIHKVYQVTGNHDFSVEENLKQEVSSALGLNNVYYTKTVGNWQFIFLNGNELSLLSPDPLVKKEAEQLLIELSKNKKPNNKEWNGGLGKEQIAWLEKQLKHAANNNIKSIIFCHYPLLPLEAHTLWDSDVVLKVISRYKGVKAWINGHNHAGNYAVNDGVHYITMKGMVDTINENAFSILTLTNEEIIVEGFHRETDRKLNVKR